MRAGNVFVHRTLGLGNLFFGGVFVLVGRRAALANNRVDVGGPHNAEPVHANHFRLNGADGVKKFFVQIIGRYPERHHCGKRLRGPTGIAHQAVFHKINIIDRRQFRNPLVTDAGLGLGHGGQNPAKEPRHVIACIVAQNGRLVRGQNGFDVIAVLVQLFTRVAPAHRQHNIIIVQKDTQPLVAPAVINLLQDGLMKFVIGAFGGRITYHEKTHCDVRVADLVKQLRPQIQEFFPCGAVLHTGLDTGDAVNPHQRPIGQPNGIITVHRFERQIIGIVFISEFRKHPTRDGRHINHQDNKHENRGHRQNDRSYRETATCKIIKKFIHLYAASRLGIRSLNSLIFAATIWPNWGSDFDTVANKK